MKQEEEYRGDTSALVYRQNFDFDNFGNLYKKSANNSTTGQANPISFTAIESSDISKSNNRLTSNTTYDDAGSVTQDTKFRNLNYAYDANGRMISSASTSNSSINSNAVYDAAGQRVAEKVNGSWKYQVYDINANLVAEYTDTAPSSTSNINYTFQDSQGSTRATTDKVGTIQSRTDYQAFGEEISAGTGQRTTNQGFNSNLGIDQKYGQTERDEATGLDHTWFRKHENKAGRWTSPDPYNGSISSVDPQSFNRYSYTQNQPTSYIDPSGLQLIAFFYPICGWRGDNYSCEQGVHFMYIPDPIEGGGGDGGGIPPRSGPCDLQTPNFDQLKAANPAAYNLLNKTYGNQARLQYANMSTYNQAVFLNTAAAVAAQGVDLSGANFIEFYRGDKANAGAFGIIVSGVSTVNLDNAGLTERSIDIGGVSTDIAGIGKSRRSPNVNVGSVEATVEDNGDTAFDVDLNNPFGSGSSFLKHQEEVRFNNKNKTTTHPADVVRKLNSRGVETGVSCK